jgi:nucleotide-binding universal stress UspA family protein
MAPHLLLTWEGGGNMGEEGSRSPLGDVLVATDFTRHSHEATARVAWLPQGTRSSVTIVHALPAVDGAIAARLHQTASALMDGARATLSAEAERAGRAGVEVLTTVEIGRPWEVVARLGRERRAELIVVGHGERRSVGERLLGSTAERIVRTSESNVLVVTRAPEGGYQRPLVAVDLSDASRRAVELTMRVVDPGARRLDVLNVCDVPYVSMLAEGGMSAAEIDRHLAETEASARNLLVSWVPRAKDAGVELNARLRRGDPRHTIVQDAIESGADLIVVGRQGHSSLGRLLLGSVVEAVVRAGTCDVLVAA